jgi:hypothetical protein
MNQRFGVTSVHTRSTRRRIPEDGILQQKDFALETEKSSEIP